MQQSTSLYTLIRENLQDGCLPDSFSLPAEPLPSGLRFADGARDGMSMYHLQAPEITDEQQALMLQALQAVMDTETEQAVAFEKAEQLFTELGRQIPAVQAIDAFQNVIRQNSEQMDVNALYSYAAAAAGGSADKEAVKYALEILEMIAVEDAWIKDLIFTLGLSDEFTVFSVWCMRNWEDGNACIFELARRVHGWGRIHALRDLQPETEEIRRWILEEGLDNRVMPDYSAAEVFDKSGAAQMLERELSYDDFCALSRLMESLLSEGPVEGISAYDNAPEILSRYMDAAAELAEGTDDYRTVLNIRKWALRKASADPAEEFFPVQEDPKTAPDKDALHTIAEKARKVLYSTKCTDMLSTAVKYGSGFDLAAELGLPFREDLYRLLCEDFDRYCADCRYLCSDPEYGQKTADLFEQKLPLKEMRKGPGLSIGLDPEEKDYRTLDMILQELGALPFTGIELLVTGLQSPVIRNRNFAIRALDRWVLDKKTPLKELAPRLYSEVCKLAGTEPDPGVKSRIDLLLK